MLCYVMFCTRRIKGVVVVVVVDAINGKIVSIKILDLKLCSIYAEKKNKL